MVGMAAGAGVASATSPEAPALEATETEALAEAARFRTEMGLPNSSSYVAAVAASVAPSKVFGIPLTPSEEALLIERTRIQSQLGPIRALERQHPDDWGGIWLTYPTTSTLDHATVVNVSVTTDADLYKDQIVKRLPAGADLAMHGARWSEFDLDSRHLDILNDADFYTSIGTQLYSVGTSVPENVLAIEVRNRDPDIERAIKEHFPAGMVRVEVGDAPQPDTCSRTNCGPPWRAGLMIYGKTDNDGCTSGFTGRYYNGIWNYVLLTGGHCQTATWHLGSAAGTTIGTTAANYFRNGTNVDVQTIPINASRAENHYLYGSKTCTNCTLNPIVESEPSNGDSVGELVLASGAVTGSSGGTLLETNRSFTMADPYRSGVSVPLTHMRRASYVRHPGDSGGPVLRAHYSSYGAYDVAAGQHTHYVTIGGTVYPIYTHVAIIEATTGYDVYTAP